MNYIYYFLLALSISEIGAQFFLKKSVDTKDDNSFLFLLVGILMYAGVGYLFRESLHAHKLGTIGLLWHVVMVLITVGISILIFNEKYNMKEYIGILFGILSLALLSHEHSH